MIITLCGSARFEPEFHLAARKLTLAGNTVFSLAVFPSADPDKGELCAADKEILDIIHFNKISISHGIFVIDKDGYIGDSTRRGILFAQQQNKLISYMSEGILDKLVPMYEIPARKDMQ